jgi:hypothetical protein
MEEPAQHGSRCRPARRRAVAVGCAFALLGLALTPTAGAATRWYVSVGGTLAAGKAPAQSFVARAFQRLSVSDRDLQLRSIASSQADAAEAFLRANRGNVPLVTLEVGLADVLPCAHGPRLDRRCLARALRRLDTRLADIVAHLQSAAGPRARFAGIVYYDPFIGAKRGAASAAVRALDRHLRAVYRRAGVIRVRLDHVLSGRLLCRMTGACRRRFDLRPNGRGQRAIADALLAAVGQLPPPPGPRAGQTGQFTTPCRYTHRAPDDPIVYPNEPGRSHSHDFFGNTSTNAGSTLDTLAASSTACRRAADRSAYWVPTLFLDGQPVTARGATIYYRDAGKDPAAVVSFPSGLRVIAGDSKATGPQSLDVVSWGCGSQSGIERQQSPPLCSGPTLRATIRFPDCWNGRDLDAADHKSHLAYALPRRGGGRACDPGHPIAVPKLTINITYPVLGGPGVTLASGPGYTEHADFFNAWDPPTLDQLVVRCLVADVRCEGTA